MEKPPLSSVESTRDKTSRLLNEVWNKIDSFEFNEKRTAFAEKIKKNNPDYKQYRTYHQLIGSQIGEKAVIENDFDGFFDDEKDNQHKEESNIIEDDFEGEYSIVGFLEGLLKTG